MDVPAPIFLRGTGQLIGHVLADPGWMAKDWITVIADPERRPITIWLRCMRWRVFSQGRIDYRHLLDVPVNRAGALRLVPTFMPFSPDNLMPPVAGARPASEVER